MAPALPLLKVEFGLSLVATGWLVSAFNTLAVGAAIFFGIFIGPPLLATAVSWSGSWDSALWILLGCALVGLSSAAAIARFERKARGKGLN